MRTSKQAAKTFDRKIVGKNVMTPHRLKVGYTKDGGIWELCEGDDFDRKPMFGVTVIINDPVQGWHLDGERGRLYGRDEGLSRSQRLSKAVKYIEEVLQ